MLGSSEGQCSGGAHRRLCTSRQRRCDTQRDIPVEVAKGLAAMGLGSATGSSAGNVAEDWEEDWEEGEMLGLAKPQPLAHRQPCHRSTPG